MVVCGQDLLKDCDAAGSPKNIDVLSASGFVHEDLLSCLRRLISSHRIKLSGRAGPSSGAGALARWGSEACGSGLGRSPLLHAKETK